MQIESTREPFQAAGGQLRAVPALAAVCDRARRARWCEGEGGLGVFTFALTASEDDERNNGDEDQRRVSAIAAQHDDRSSNGGLVNARGPCVRDGAPAL